MHCSNPGPLLTTLSGLLDGIGAGVIYLDRPGRILTANDRAREILRAGCVLVDHDGVLRSPSPQNNADLKRLLARALPPGGVEGKSGSLALTGCSTGIPVPVVHVAPVNDGKSGDADVPVPVAAIVFVVDPRTPGRIDRKLTAAAFGLTRAESDVVVQLAEGRSVREIAVATAREESTIRGHIKRILAKLGLSRQTSLVPLVLALAGFPGLRD